MNHVDHLTGSSNDSLELFGRGSMTPFFFLFFGETCSNSSYSWHTDRGEGEAKRVRTLNTRVKWLGWGENSKSGAPVTGRRRKSFTVVRKLACRGKLSLSLFFSLAFPLPPLLAFCLRPFFAYWATIIPPLSLLSPRDKGRRRGVNLCVIVSLSLLEVFSSLPASYFSFFFSNKHWRNIVDDDGKLRGKVQSY